MEFWIIFAGIVSIAVIAAIVASVATVSSVGAIAGAVCKEDENEE